MGADLVPAGPDPRDRAKAIDYALSPDRRRLVITKIVDSVKVTYTFEWTFDPSDELVASAIDHFRHMLISADDIVGRKLELKRIGPVCIEWSTGPPTWWLPRLKVEGGRRWHFRIGWLRLAVGIWRFGGRSPAGRGY